MIYLGCALDSKGIIVRFTISSNRPGDSDNIKLASLSTARWSTKEKVWRVPPDPTILRRVVDYFPEHSISPLLQSHLDNLMGRQQDIYSSSSMDDPVASGKVQLMPFQNASVRVLESAGSFILAHQMGLGKTPIACQTLEYIGASKNIIVCPSSVKWSWVDHLKQWADIHNIFVLESSKVTTDVATVIYTHRDEKLEKEIKKGDITLVMGYEMMKKHLSTLLKFEYDVIIFDEAHKLKNRKAQVTQAAMQMSSVCARRWLLTGTPVRNDYTDLYSLLAIVDPQRFTSFWNFVNLYLETASNIFGGTDIVGLKSEEDFNSMLSVYMYKLTKEEVLPELPEIIYNNTHLPLNKKQQKAYDQMEEDFMLYVQEQAEETGSIEPVITAPNTITKIIRLRQICLMPEIIGGPDDSAKLDWLEEQVENLLEQGERLLIFSFFKGFIHYVASLLDHRGLSYGMITGDVKSSERNKVEKKLTAGEVDIVIGTGQSMGEGMNLQAATTAIFTDLDWVPAVNKQAEERIHRGDIKKSPNVIRLIHPNTVEQDILSTLYRKERITSKATGQVETIRNLLRRRGIG